MIEEGKVTTKDYQKRSEIFKYIFNIIHKMTASPANKA